jgi:flavin-dependent dehydrogenase
MTKHFPTHQLFFPTHRRVLNKTLPTQRHDVVVVGARCAGAATALLLAAAGHDVVLVDRGAFPSDTLSTHAIARSGVVQLNRWGLLPAVLDAGTPPIREVVFHGGGTPVRRSVKDRLGVDMLVAPRRHVLDALLVDAAVAAGAHLMTGLTVDGVRRGGDGRVVGVRGRGRGDGGRLEIGARFVVGADGLRSRIARCVDARFTHVRGAGDGAVHYAYFAGDWPAMEYYLGDGSFAGVFPTNNAEACVWVCSPADVAKRFRRSHITVDLAFNAMVRAAAPDLAERLATSATRRSSTRGMIGLPNQLRHPVGPGWALVGDAGYHRDPITGHGISDAFRDAELLATALDHILAGDDDEVGALARYHTERDHQLRDIFEITCELTTYPPAHRFIELQKQLASAIDTQAETLATRPLPRLATAVA